MMLGIACDAEEVIATLKQVGGIAKNLRKGLRKQIRRRFRNRDDRISEKGKAARASSAAGGGRDRTAIRPLWKARTFRTLGLQVDQLPEWQAQPPWPTLR